MARIGHEEEDGWTLYSKTAEQRAGEGEQLDVEERQIKWSATSQLRSRVETAFLAEEIFHYLFETFNVKDIEQQLAAKSELAANSIVKRAQGSLAHIFVETAADGCSVTSLYYRVVPLPW